MTNRCKHQPASTMSRACRPSAAIKADVPDQVATMISRVLTTGLAIVLQIVLCSGLASADSLVIEADKSVVDLHLALGLNGPGARASAGGSIVSSLKEGDDATVDIGDYRLTMLVVKNEETKFTLDLSFSDKKNVVKGSRRVTVSVDRPAMFDISVDDMIIEGVIEVVDVFDSPESYNRRIR